MSIKITSAYVNPDTVLTNSYFTIVAEILEYFLLKTNSEEIVCSSDGNEIFLPTSDYTSQYSGEDIDSFITFMLSYIPQLQNYRDYTLSKFNDWTLTELSNGFQE